MEDNAAQITRLRSQIDDLTYGLESLGAAARLTQKGRIAVARRELATLSAPATAAAAPAADARGA